MYDINSSSSGKLFISFYVGTNTR